MSSDGSTVLFSRALPAPLRFSAEQKRGLKDFARTLSEQIASQRSFTCLLANDRVLHRLNRQFLGHDYATDVLSFPDVASNGSLGELAISVERAASQAAEFGHDRIDEIRVLMLHGLLHLIGMDHEWDHGEMARAERKWRSVFGLPLTLLARKALGERAPGKQVPSRVKGARL